MTIDKCLKCHNNGVMGACMVTQTTGGQIVCNFSPINGSQTIVISNEVYHSEYDPKKVGNT